MQAVYYCDRKGCQPVDEFLETLEDRKAAAIDKQIDRLNDLSPNDPPLPHPWSSQVEGGLRELRCHYGPELYRVLYRRSRNLFATAAAPGRRPGRAMRARPGYRLPLLVKSCEAGADHSHGGKDLR